MTRKKPKVSEPSDPQMYEPQLLDVLSVPAGVLTVERLQSGALMSVVDAFDRRIMRYPFIDLVQAAMVLNNQLGRLTLVAAIAEEVKNKTVTPEKLAEAIVGLTERAEIQRLKVLKLMQLVAACPTSEDNVH